MDPPGDALRELLGEKLHRNPRCWFAFGNDDASFNDCLGHQGDGDVTAAGGLNLAVVARVIEKPRLTRHQPKRATRAGHGPHGARLAFEESGSGIAETAFGQREFEVAVPIGQHRKSIVRGVDESAADGSVRDGIDHGAVNRGRRFVRLRSLGRSLGDREPRKQHNDYNREV